MKFDIHKPLCLSVMLSMTDFTSVLLSTPVYKVSCLRPSTELAVLMILSNQMVSLALMLLAQHTATDCLQHVAAHLEGSQLPQEIKSAYPLRVHSLGVRFPVQSIVNHHDQVFVLNFLPPDPNQL